MKKLYLSILVLLLFTFTSLHSQKLHFENKSFEWSVPVCISDSGYTPYSGPIFSVINSNNIIFAYTESPFLPPDYKNINVYVRELRNGILSDTINLTNSIYNSYWPVIKTDRKGITHLIWGISLTTPSAFSSYAGRKRQSRRDGPSPWPWASSGRSRRTGRSGCSGRCG